MPENGPPPPGFEKPIGAAEHVERAECAIVVSQDLLNQTLKIAKIGPRSSMVHSLLASYRLLAGVRLLSPARVTLSDLRAFHSEDYVAFLQQPEQCDEEDFGLGYDCPVLADLAEFACAIAGGSIAAADALVAGQVRVAVNWHGGWHHAKRDAASGFCYVNDIVLAIHRLQGRFSRVMYVDLDVHHGDGVEEAFSCTHRVLTLSIHRQEPGFFPGSGTLQDVGFGRGRYHAVNVPLKEGVDDAMFTRVFGRIFWRAVARFMPDAIVVQCGADGLAGDPLGGFNLTEKGLSACVKQVVKYGAPVLLLGGGGYHLANTARCWAQVMADLTATTIPTEIPDTDPFFLSYGPDYEISINPGCIKNANSAEAVEQLLQKIEQNLDQLPIS